MTVTDRKPQPGPLAAPVTTAISRRLQPGAEAGFKRWTDEILSSASTFPGYLGAGYIRPATSDGEHTIIYRFASPEQLQTWQSSPERMRWVETSREFIAGVPRLEIATGLEYWFHDPGCSYGSPPPRWKQALLTWLGLYPAALLVAYTAGATLESGGLPEPLRILVTTGLVVPMMAWAVMPLVTKVFRGWLRQRGAEDHRQARLLSAPGGTDIRA